MDRTCKKSRDLYAQKLSCPVSVSFCTVKEKDLRCIQCVFICCDFYLLCALLNEKLARMNELAWAIWRPSSDIHNDKMRKAIEYNRIVISCLGSNWINSVCEVIGMYIIILQYLCRESLLHTCSCQLYFVIKQQ